VAFLFSRYEELLPKQSREQKKKRAHPDKAALCYWRKNTKDFLKQAGPRKNHVHARDCSDRLVAAFLACPFPG